LGARLFLSGKFLQAANFYVERARRESAEKFFAEIFEKTLDAAAPRLV
jgi:hypothetical protein